MSAQPHHSRPPSLDCSAVVVVGLTCTDVTEFVGVCSVTVVTVPGDVTVFAGAVTVFAGCVTVGVAGAVAVLLRWVVVVAVDAAARTCSATVPEPPEPHELTTAALRVPAMRTANSVDVCRSRVMSESGADRRRGGGDPHHLERVSDRLRLIQTG